MKHIIDATNQSLGRIAAQAATLLRGKGVPTYKPYEMPRVIVTVENVKKIKFTGNKLAQKKYFHYSGFHGGITEMPLEKLFAKRPGEVLRKAVFGMLAANKLRAKIIKNLIIHE